MFSFNSAPLMVFAGFFKNKPITHCLVYFFLITATHFLLDDEVSRKAEKNLFLFFIHVGRVFFGTQNFTEVSFFVIPFILVISFAFLL